MTLSNMKLTFSKDHVRPAFEQILGKTERKETEIGWNVENWSPSAWWVVKAKPFRARSAGVNLKTAVTSDSEYHVRDSSHKKEAWYGDQHVYWLRVRGFFASLLDNNTGLLGIVARARALVIATKTLVYTGNGKTILVTAGGKGDWQWEK